MELSPIDSLRLAQRLEEIGLPRGQSEEIALYLRGAASVVEPDLVRAGDLKRLPRDVARELAAWQGSADEKLLLLCRRIDTLRSGQVQQQFRSRKIESLLRWVVVLLAALLLFAAVAVGFLAHAAGLFASASRPVNETAPASAPAAGDRADLGPAAV